MKRADKVLQDLEQIAKAIDLPKGKLDLDEAKEFLEETRFTKYSIHINYYKNGSVKSVDLDVGHFADSPFCSQTQEFSTSFDIYKKK